VPFALREPAPGVNLTAGPAALGVALWLAAKNAQAVHDHLVESGVTIRTELFDGPFGRTFAFEDPDGYVVTVHVRRDGDAGLRTTVTPV
jgi:predicted enzyme related to lactoylglutathione lyase